MQRRLSEADIQLELQPLQQQPVVVEAVVAAAVDASTPGGTVVPVVTATAVAEAVPSGAELTRTQSRTERTVELVRVVSRSRPVITTSGREGQRGVPVVKCMNGAGKKLGDLCEPLCMGVCSLLAYAVMAVIIIGGAGLIGTFTASTDLYNAGLGFVSWLLCMLLFCVLSICCAGVLSVTSNDSQLPSSMAAFCMALGVLSSVLCIILSHPLNRLHALDSGGKPLLENIVLINGTLNSPLTQEGAGEVAFAPHHYLDLSLGFALVADEPRSCGEECSYDATVARICAAPVMNSCGGGILPFRSF